MRKIKYCQVIKKNEIGSYIDEKITECDTGEVYLNETYMMTSREVENLGKEYVLVYLYPQSLLDKKSFGRDYGRISFWGLC